MGYPAKTWHCRASGNTDQTDQSRHHLPRAATPLPSHLNDGALNLAGTCVESFGCLRLPWKPDLNHLIPALAAFRFHFLPRRAPAPRRRPISLSRSISFGCPCPTSLPISPPPVRVRRRQRVPGPVLVSPSRPCDRRPSHPIFSPVPCSLHPEPGLPCHKASRTRATLALSACAPEPPSALSPPLPHSPQPPSPPPQRAAPPTRSELKTAPSRSLFVTVQDLSVFLRGLLPSPNPPSGVRCLPLSSTYFFSPLCRAIPHGPPLSPSFSSLLHARIRSPLLPFLPALPVDPYVSPGILRVLLNPSLAPYFIHPALHPRCPIIARWRAPSVLAHLRDEVSAPAPHALIMLLRPSFSSSSSSRRRRPAAHAGFLLLFAICDLLCTARSLNAAYLSTARRPEIPPQTQIKRNSTAAFPAVRIPIPDGLPTRPVCVPALVSHRNIWGLPIRT
ncbi:hypothetical protein DFH09DRAFT_1377716 [Mycena vulgaris]|nr:hypothetical protein DFH09DRAFT_1377716 [Mycena vulgaris]